MILIFDSELGGHHLEYIHHYWTGIAECNSDEQYTIAVPKKEWERLRKLCEWPCAKNITLRLLTDAELTHKSKMPFFRRSKIQPTITLFTGP